MKVNIDNLTFKTIIGILPFERVKKQQVIVNVSFVYKFDSKSKEFIDYSIVANIIKKQMKKKKFELIEEAIIYLKSKLQKEFNLKKLNIKITKPTILKNCIVSVESY